MEFYLGQWIYESGQSYMEEDDGEGRRRIPRDEWINSLPDAWRKHVSFDKEADVSGSINYFTNLKTEFQKNCSRLQLYADKHERSPRLRFISDINDEEYDKFPSGTEYEKMKSKLTGAFSRLETQKSKLYELISDCVKEKKLAITMCENIAEIEGKPKEIPLSVWHLLPMESKQIVLLSGEQHESKFYQRGLLMLTGLVRKLHDENVKYKKDVETLCLKDIDLQMEKDKMLEAMGRQKEQLRNAEARFRTKLETETRSLTSQINQLRKEIEFQKQRQFFLQETISSKIKEVEGLKQEKESLLTRLSEVAGSKLTMNNPAITDLSDKYRPMKLSEMFSGVYDDDWTDAVEELSSEGIEEKTVVILLRNMVMTAYKLCKESHVIMIRLPECKLLEWCDEFDQEKAKKPHILEVELREEERELLKRYTHDFKRNHQKSLIKTCQERFIPMVFEMIQGAQTPIRHSTEDGNMQHKSVETNPDDKSFKNKPDFTRPMYQKDFPFIGNQTERPPSPKKQKTSLHISLEKDQSIVKETVCDRKTQSARADFARQTQQNDTRSEPEQQNIKPKSDQDVGIKSMDSNAPVSDKNRFPKVLGFANRIVELCWWMQAVQPQVHLDCSVPADGNFSHDHYKAYMKSGSKIDYIVWPVMFLHENGPLLSKGVAQPL